MERLDAIEKDFQSFLLTGSAAIEARVVGTQRVPIATRLAIYGDGYRSRLLETLESHYPALLAHLGAERFGALGRAYVQAYDSTFPSIRFYGAALADFLASHQHYASEPWLCELARFEWVMMDVFDGADAAPLGVQALSQIAPEEWANLGFDLHPTVRRLDLVWNAPALWRALTDAQEPPAPQAHAVAAAWLLWRQELQIYFRALPPLEAASLDLVRQGGRFGTLCDALCAALGESQAPSQAAAFLRQWVESGMIVGMRGCEE